MDEIKFNSLEDLYQRIRPALNSKLKELKIQNKTYINEENIFEYLSEKKWINTTNLTLDQIVSDISYIDNYKLDDYVQHKIITEKLKKIKESDMFNNEN